MGRRRRRRAAELVAALIRLAMAGQLSLCFRRGPLVQADVVTRQELVMAGRVSLWRPLRRLVLRMEEALRRKGASENCNPRLLMPRRAP